MNMLDRLFGKPNFLKFDDCYALTRQQLRFAISDAIHSQQSPGRVILVVCHFANTFTAMQERLSATNTEYEIVTRRLTVDRLKSRQDPAGSLVLLTLAQLIDEQTDSRLKPPLESTRELAIIVCERHPLREKDLVVERFGKAIPFPTQLGYFLALDDAVVRIAINDTTVELMQQMGLKDQDLVSSNMVTKRLNKVLSRLEKQFKSDLQADSAEQWIRINGVGRDITKLD